MVEFLGHYARELGSYKKRAVETVTRPIAKARPLERATAIPPFELLCELPELTPVLVGTGVRVELKREDEDKMLLLLPLPPLLAGRPEGELGGREELSEGRSGEELVSSISVPVPQGILSPFG